MNTLIKKSALALMSITLAIPVTMASTSMSQAGSRDAFVGGLVGGVVGGVIGSSRSRQREVIVVEPRRVQRQPVYIERGGTSAHTNWCANRYRSYDVRSNTYVSYGGRVKQCRSPY